MKIFIASDHVGFELKQVLIPFLTSLSHEIIDMGPHALNRDDDYPDFVSKVAEAVSADPDNSKGIVLGMSGQGEAIVANRFKGVRAIVYYGEMPEIISLSREHNDANVLSLGAGFLSADDAKMVVEDWLKTSFSGEERHKRRIEKIEKYG